MGTPSGKTWVSRFPTSKSLGDLKGSFASSAKQFVAALKDAGAKVAISATFRPPERAYLMHYCYEIAHNMDPASVPPMKGVDIEWVHKDKEGKPDPKASRKAASEMAAAFQLAYRPALKSRHTQGLAVDMSVTWSGTLKIRTAAGKETTITSNPRNGGNKDLQAVGKDYGVVKLKSDPPHWSSDGH